LRLKNYKGHETGIIRKITDDWAIFPSRECMRTAGLLPNTYYMTIMLRDGGIALIPYNLEEEEKDREG
jgi:hypothetical protein